MLRNKEIYQLEQQLDWLEEKLKYKRLNKIEMHKGQPEILAYIYMHKDCKQYEIAKYLGISRASIGVSVKRMEKQGFIEVVPNKEDARATMLQITKKGVKLLVQSDMVMDEYITKKYDGFSDDEIDQYIRLQTKIKNNLSSLYKKDESDK
ncbi:MarR family winged helix-turn-helix transcriptional regulator [Breznakia pachnodae]|uniref:DNA-binding MarR family transcriptional regulator n=1 Tax=Breznakia pachnodae TaxID=265178 RepID=A0ABU0E8D0_9FIRM|nr:MarR family transcriptional regulator [Breznakia pachnodae]MDQ0362974.1 DNA-binding MarR family transcriptional regulator [Breznakia pachnodae]